jgi:hypothetical protein
MFHLFSRRMLQVCLSGCCICFTHMLQVYYLDVAYVCNVFQVFFQVFQMHVSSVSSDFFVRYKCLHLDVLKSRSGVAHEMHMGNRRGHEWSLRGHTGGTGSRVSAGDAGPRVDAQNRTGASVRTFGH